MDRSTREEIKSLREEIDTLHKKCLELELDAHELATKESIYTRLVNRGNDGIVIIADGILRFVNKKGLLMAGYSEDEILGHYFTDFVAPEYKSQIEKHYEARMRGEVVPHQYETVLVSKSGRLLSIELNASLIRYRGKLADMAILRDISKRKITEQKLKETLLKIEQLHEVAFNLENCNSKKDVLELANSTFKKLLHLELSRMKFIDENRIELIIQGKKSKKKQQITVNLEKGIPNLTPHFQQSDHLQQDFRLLGLLLRHVYGALKRIYLQEKLQRQALHDPLTGVYNRYYLIQFLDKEMNRSKRNKTSIGLLMIDVDRFKEINDTFGHRTGDQVLVLVAEIIRESIRDCDMIIRHGGDEFLVILPETEQQAELVKQRIYENARNDNDIIKLLKFPLTLSIGCAYWSPGTEKNLGDILSLADQRMYQEKTKSKETPDQGS